MEKGRQAAYLSDVRVPFLARPSEMYFAPSSPSLLTERLQTGVKRTRQRALTTGKRACGGVLEGREGRVLLQALGKVLGGLRVELVGAEAVNGSQTEASAGLNSREWATK